MYDFLGSSSLPALPLFEHRTHVATQSLHHAMPTVSCAHFPEMYAEYEEICSRHGVQIRQSENVVTATREMLEYIFENNDPHGRSGQGGAPVFSSQ